MRYRHGVNKNKDSRVFTNTAKKSIGINYYRSNTRGGIRL